MQHPRKVFFFFLATLNILRIFASVKPITYMTMEYITKHLAQQLVCGNGVMDAMLQLAEEREQYAFSGPEAQRLTLEVVTDKFAPKNEFYLQSYAWQRDIIFAVVGLVDWDEMAILLNFRLNHLRK